jgi:hypothetical protein
MPWRSLACAMIFHPAALLLAWTGFALSLQWAGIATVLAAAFLSLAAALHFAPARCRNLLYRSRWLLLSLAALFVFFTPGEYLEGAAGSIGVTWEGLILGGEHLGRLLALLASLALLHEHVGTQGLLAGLHTLLAPFPWRETTVVRLMLVLEHVERRPSGNWREWLTDETAGDGEMAALSLSQQKFRARDLVLVGLLLLGLLWGWLT